MRRIAIMMVVLGLLVALTLVIGASVASAFDGNPAPASSNDGPETCLVCHKGDPTVYGDLDDVDGGGNPDGANAVYAAAHDSSVGQCGTCHTYENESIHGEWDDTPEACARCHRTHSAVEDDLLAMGKDELCLFCHGKGAGLAQTNVLDGLLRSDSGSLRGGGFEKATMETATHSGDNGAGYATTVEEWQFPVSGVADGNVTSKHTLGVKATIWGSWGNTSEFSEVVANAGDTNTVLECVSCHDPHAYGQTYRMLTRRPGDSGVVKDPNALSAPWEKRVFVTDQLRYAEQYPSVDVLAYTTPDYSKLEIGPKSWVDGNWTAIKMPGTSYATVDVLDSGGAVKEVVLAGGPDTADMYSQQLAAWCASCHDRYNAQSAADTGDLIFAHRHQTAQAVAGNETVGYTADVSYGGKVKGLSCVNCHVAHGTTAFMTPYVTALPWPGETDAGHFDTLGNGTELGEGWLLEDPNLNEGNETDHDGNKRSNLLRIDNRGVCQNPACHPKGKNNYVVDYD